MTPPERTGVNRQRAVLQLDGVSKTYPGGAAALDNATLAIQPGEFVVIVGPSGAGKSTMLRCINLLVRPSRGTIAIDGEIVRGNSGSQLRAVRGRVGMIFQQFGLVGRLSVMTNVLAGRLRFHSGRPPAALSIAARIGAAVVASVTVLAAFSVLDTAVAVAVGAAAAAPVTAAVGFWCWKVGPSVVGFFPASDRAAAVEALEAVGIAHLAPRRADQLSGGQQQRVAIARTLAQEPALLLADEPIASLDPVSAESVMDALQRINRERAIPVVVNLHQVDIARRYATRIIGMSAGRVIFDGPPDQLTEGVVDRIYRSARSYAPIPGPDVRADGREHPAESAPVAAAPTITKESPWVSFPARSSTSAS